MTPIVLAATLLVALLTLFLPRRYALGPILAVTFLTPFGAQILAGGFHLFVFRIVVLAGLVRIIYTKLTAPATLFAVPLGRLDQLFAIWAISRAVTFVLLNRQLSAVTNQVAFCLDAFGGYFLFRYFLQNDEDIVRIGKHLAFIASVLAAGMLLEYKTQVNAFNFLRNEPVTPLIRHGRVRAEAVFGNSITAGSFGATLLPLFFWLLKSGRARVLGAVGLLSSFTMVFSSVAGTPYSTFGATLIALCAWPIRRSMRYVRWGFVVAVLILAMVMKAPVWFIIARVDLVGGAHAWDRANLIDQFVRHFSEWWLLGTSTNAAWGFSLWDACNQFVYEGISGGLVSLCLFIAILSRAFSMVGTARKSVEPDRRQEWFFWSLGLVLFAHLMSFWGIDYFDQTRIWWYCCLAMIPPATALTASPLAETKSRRDPVDASEYPAVPAEEEPVWQKLLHQ
jgi:hypothetical protein